MPIYEFYSPDTHKIYSFFARSLSGSDKIPRCPDNPAARMERQVSGFAVTSGKREEGEGGADDSKMEAAMAQLESEMGAIDEENPDPRQLGQLMRRMSDLTGEKLPGPMREMVERLERGEDPEKLEEDYGDMLDEDGDGLFGEDTEGTGRKAHDRVARWWKKQKAPERDANLYEFRDYTDTPS